MSAARRGATQVGLATVEVDSWRGRVRLAALRAVLQGGLQAHLARNATVHQALGIDGDAAQARPARARPRGGSACLRGVRACRAWLRPAWRGA